MIFDCAQILIAAYFVAIALGALTGRGLAVAAYPFQALASLIRLLLSGITLGRVSVESQGRRLRRRSRYHARQWRSALRQWRQERDESKQIERGESPGHWASIQD